MEGSKSIGRISSGIEGLDLKLDGGYPEGRSILITGGTGTGKSIFGIHFLYSACRNGKKCVLIATEEIPEDIIKQSEILGLGLSRYYESGQLVIEKAFQSRSEKVQTSKYGFTPEGLEIELPSLADFIPSSTEVVVIDNIGVFTLRLSIQDFRDQFDALNFVLSSMEGCTAMFIMDETACKMAKNIAEYSVTGSLRLSVNENPYTGNTERYLTIPKMRRTNLKLESIRFEITLEGIRLF
ncbi:MAG: ATPase domain-containing protein [Methanosarcinaceae archaeon]|nr:ATPase domain-containing protein [Methanosarcinaceae archaeon]